MSGKRRSSSQLARDRRLIADLYLQGWIQADIAESLSLSQPTISRDLAAIQGDWLASTLIDFNKAKARELAKIDRLEREYWDAWNRSREDAETLVTKGRGTKDKPNQVERTTKQEGQTGNPAYLRGVQWCIEQRCKILGLEAARKQEHSGPGGGPLVPFDLASWQEKARAARDHVRDLDEIECANEDD